MFAVACVCVSDRPTNLDHGLQCDLLLTSHRNLKLSTAMRALNRLADVNSKKNLLVLVTSMVGKEVNEESIVMAELNEGQRRELGLLCEK
jgi:hypothetical protein